MIKVIFKLGREECLGLGQCRGSGEGFVGEVTRVGALGTCKGCVGPGGGGEKFGGSSEWP